MSACEPVVGAELSHLSSRKACEGTTPTGRKIVSGALWIAIETWGRQAMLFGVFVILARLLGPDAIGLAALALVAPVILAVPVTCGIPDAIIQRSDIDPEHLDSAFWLLAGTGAGLSALVVLLGQPIANVFGQPLVAELMRGSGLIIFIQSLAGVPIAILKRQLNFRVLAMRTLVGTVASGAVGVGLALNGYGVWSLIWMQVAKSVCEVVVLLLGSAWRPRLRFSYDKCKDLLGFAVPIVGFSIWGLVNDEMPKVFIGTILGPSAVGIYTLARRPLDALTSAFLAPLSGIAMPAVSRLLSDRAKIDRFFNNSIRITVLIGFPAFMGLAAIAPDAVPLVFGPHWSEGVLAVQVMMLLGLVRTVDTICGGTMLALGYAKLILTMNVLYTLAAIVALPLAAMFSVEAVIAAIILCNLVFTPLFLYYTHKLVGIDVLRPLAIIPRVAIATGLMMIGVKVWLLATADLLHPTAAAITAIGFGGLIYAMAAVMLIRPDLLAARDMLLKARG